MNDQERLVQAGMNSDQFLEHLDAADEYRTPRWMREQMLSRTEPKSSFTQTTDQAYALDMGDLLDFRLA